MNKCDMCESSEYLDKYRHLNLEFTINSNYANEVVYRVLEALSEEYYLEIVDVKIMFANLYRTIVEVDLKILNDEMYIMKLGTYIGSSPYINKYVLCKEYKEVILNGRK
jgi:hypothetical protein